MVGIVTLLRALILRDLIEERERFEVETRHKVAAVVIGATTGFVIGITSAGSRTVIAILLIAVYRLAPKKVVGTDIVHAAILLSAAAIAHWVGGNIDFGLAANILVGSIPRRDHRRRPLRPRPAGFIRTRARPRSWSARASRHRAERRPDRLADRRLASPRSGSGGVLYAPHWTSTCGGAARTSKKRLRRPPRPSRSPPIDSIAACVFQRRADYAVRAAAELAAAGDDAPVKGERLADAQEIPAPVPRAHPARAEASRHRPAPGAAPKAATGWPGRPTR